LLLQLYCTEAVQLQHAAIIPRTAELQFSDYQTCDSSMLLTHFHRGQFPLSDHTPRLLLKRASHKHTEQHLILLCQCSAAGKYFVLFIILKQYYWELAVCVTACMQVNNIDAINVLQSPFRWLTCDHQQGSWVLEQFWPDTLPQSSKKSSEKN